MRAFVVALAFLSLGTRLGAQALDRSIGIRIDSIFAAYASPRSPGCAVAVTRQGAIVFERGYGMASIEQQVPISPATVFDLGSVSKQFTAASVLLLQLEGKLSIDDDVRRYLPELPDLGRKVTLRHLLTHTSGWRDYNDLLIIEGMDERDHTTNRDAWDSLKRQRAFNFVPGATYRYSNSGFFLLGEVVQRVSGMSLARYAASHIFEPLGMTQTQFLDDTRRIVPGRATAYAPDGDGYVVEMSNWDQVGDGGVQSTVRDLAKWEANFDSKKVGGKALRDLMLTHGVLNSGAQIGYTAGLVEVTYRGVERISHSGAWAGYRAALTHFPKQHTGILVTCNRADAATTSVSMRIANLLIPFEPAAAIARSKGAPVRALFVSDANGDRRMVETRGDTVFLGRTPLTAINESTYTDTTRTLSVRLTPNRLILTPLGEDADTLHRETPATQLTAAALREFVGRYSSPEVATPYEVLERDGRLWFRLGHGDDMPLDPAYTDAFDPAALPSVRFLRDERGNVTAMSFTGRGIHDLRMLKQ